MRNGVRIFEFQPLVLHGKMSICDDWVSVGSSNLDRWSFKWNLEANQEIDNAAFANVAATVFEKDCGQSQELDRHRWRRRAWIDRLQERPRGVARSVVGPVAAAAFVAAFVLWPRRGQRSA